MLGAESSRKKVVSGFLNAKKNLLSKNNLNRFVVGTRKAYR